MVLYGKILNEHYAQLLMRQPDLLLTDILLLDKVQKGVVISKESAAMLRKKNLIEGRYPHVYPAAEIAVKTEKIEEYLENKGYDDTFYIQAILQYICMKGHASHTDIVNLLKKHLSAILSEEEQRKKVSNLLSLTLSARKKWIRNIGGKGRSCWELTEAGAAQCRLNNQSCHRKTCKTL